MPFRPVFSFPHSLRCIAACLACLIGGMASANDKPSVESLFAQAAISEMAISPDGDYVAMLSRGREKQRSLVVMNLADMEPKVLMSSPQYDISDVHWVNDQRLVFSTDDHDIAQGDYFKRPGLFAINRDGSHALTLVPMGEDQDRGAARKLDLRFVDVDGSTGSNFIYAVREVYTNLWDFKALNLIKVDTLTGRQTDVERPGDTVDWIIDERGVPRMSVTQSQDKSAVFYLSPTDLKWQKIEEFSTYTGTDFDPMGFDGAGNLYVVANNKSDTSSLYRYDLAGKKLQDKPLVSIEGYDFSGRLVVDGASGKLVGVRYLSDAWSTVWLDEAHRKVQQAVDTQLPATTNALFFAHNGQMDKVLVAASSDILPRTYLLYDVKEGHLTELGKSHPEIDPKQMSHQTMVHYAARDGLQIPAYLTMPRGAPKKNLPMVLMVHGGPYTRGNVWGWNPETQFLASRGYVVLEPEFRGSTGFGQKFARAGWKQWGLAMQDDVADAAKWAIAQGIADPKRICIAGASYGGYATLMGLAKDPDLFRCGVDWVGVTDINLMYKADWANDLPPQWQNFGMPLLIGDPVKDAEQLRATSPVNIADRVKQPLLMAYGGSDRRVPIEHGRAFRDAVRNTNDKVEWIEYAEEGHGWLLLKNNIDFWTRVEKFLDANIGH